MATVRVKPLTSVIGAEIDGVDLREPITDDVAAMLRQALLHHLVIFFRDQDITTEQQRELAEVFGPIIVLPNNLAGELWPGATDVFRLVAPKGPRGTLASADEFHVDVSRQERPNLGVVLHAQTVPAVGGDTCFASMYAAYDALSPAMQALLDPLTAVHTNALLRMRTARSDADDKFAAIEAVHPVVRVHPDTGRKLLYVNVAQTSRIVELAEMESDAVLHFLFTHVKEPTFQCRFRWGRHSLAVWDNRASQHYATTDYSGPRVMRRVVIGSDDRPSGPVRATETAGV